MRLNLRVRSMLMLGIVHCVPPSQCKSFRDMGDTDHNGFMRTRANFHSGGVEKDPGSQRFGERGEIELILGDNPSRN